MDSLKREYNEYYRENPQKWASVSHDEEIFKVISILGQPVNLLDIGCGNGHTIEFIQRHWPNCFFTGIDLSDVAIDICASKRIPNSKFAVTDVQDYRTSEKYEMIVLAGVVEHFINLSTCLRKVYNLLDKKGIAFVEIPNCIAYSMSDGTEGYRRVNQGSRQMEWHYFRETWEELFIKEGFDIKESIEGKQLWNQFQWLLGKTE